MAFLRIVRLSGSGGGTTSGSASTYVGDIGDIWADDVDFNTLRRGDGVTPGGVIISAGSSFDGQYSSLTDKPQDINTIEYINFNDPADPHYGITYNAGNLLPLDASYTSIIENYITSDSFLTIQPGTFAGQHKIISVEGSSNSWLWKIRAYHLTSYYTYTSPFGKSLHLVWHPGSNSTYPGNGNLISPPRWHLLTREP